MKNGPAHILKDSDSYWCGGLRPHSGRMKLFGGLEHAIHESHGIAVCAACCDAGAAALKSLNREPSRLNPRASGRVAPAEGVGLMARKFVLKRVGTPRWDSGQGFFSSESGFIRIVLQESTTEATELELTVTSGDGDE